MAARKSRKSKAKKAASTAGRTHVANHKFAGREYDCYGKRVKAGRGNKKVPRIFCARKA